MSRRAHRTRLLLALTLTFVLAACGSQVPPDKFYGGGNGGNAAGGGAGAAAGGTGSTAGVGSGGTGLGVKNHINSKNKVLVT